jgi:multidrug efflux pump subunit AcrB
MSRFANRNPYFVAAIRPIIALVGITSLKRMPVDMFPAMNTRYVGYRKHTFLPQGAY